MAKPAEGTYWGELLKSSLYKRNQGRLSRQLTAAGVGLLFVLGAYTLSLGPLSVASPGVRIGVPLLVAAAGCWAAFRLVNYPKVAEFLISVEGEMNKVSWASKDELYRATIVVLTTMFFLALVLWVYDFIWLNVLSFMGIIQT